MPILFEMYFLEKLAYVLKRNVCFLCVHISMRQFNVFASWMMQNPSLGTVICWNKNFTCPSYVCHYLLLTYNYFNICTVYC
jgi:hypothetical protein